MLLHREGRFNVGRLDAYGAVEIMLTPVASKNPFVGFKVNRSDKSNYKILVKDNHGGTSLVEGQ